MGERDEKSLPSAPIGERDTKKTPREGSKCIPLPLEEGEGRVRVGAVRDSRNHFRFHKPWEGMRSARLNLLEAFSQAMTSVSSTTASSS